MSRKTPGRRPLTDAGLCANCRHARVMTSRRSTFLRCTLAEVDPDFPRYPDLPVRVCSGHSPGPVAPQPARAEGTHRG